MTDYRRTTTSVQNDTLDSIAYRFFGDASNQYLIELVQLNSLLSPFAKLSQGTVVVLPDTAITIAKESIQLWD